MEQKPTTEEMLNNRPPMPPGYQHLQNENPSMTAYEAVSRQFGIVPPGPSHDQQHPATKVVRKFKPRTVPQFRDDSGFSSSSSLASICVPTNVADVGVPSKSSASVSHRKTGPIIIPPEDAPLEDDPLVCKWQDCGEVAYGPENLANHVTDHHIRVQPGASCSCKWEGCTRDMTFRAHYMLILHVRRHIGHRPHVCHYPNCKNSYSRLENLITHLRQHTGEKPFKCEYCEKVFNNRSDRTKHRQRIHSNFKAYACFVVKCNKRYTDPSSLRKHLKGCHGEQAFQLYQTNKRQYKQAFKLYIPEDGSPMLLVTDEDLILMGVILPEPAPIDVPSPAPAVVASNEMPEVPVVASKAPEINTENNKSNSTAY